MSTNIFGQYQSQESRALSQINSSKYPDTNKDFEANLRRLNSFVDYLAGYVGQMQKGVDQANRDAIGRIRDTVSNLVVLLGGGELLHGIDLGDLQYFLPALGAIFGFDADRPFPLNLFEMAEHLLLGYVVPLSSFTDTINGIILGWLTAAGLPESVIEQVSELMDAINELTTDIRAFFNTLGGFLSIFGLNLNEDNTGILAPLADIWHVLTQLVSHNTLQRIGDLADPVLEDLAPWVEDLVLIINNVDNIIKAFTGGVSDLQGFINFASFFTQFVDFFPSGTFDALTTWTTLFRSVLTGSGIPGLDASKIISGVIAAARLQPLIDAISSGFGGPTGLTFTGLNTFLTGLPAAQALLDKIYNALTGTATTGHSLGDVYSALLTFPASLIHGLLDGSTIPTLDASIIVSGILSQALIPALTSGWGKTIASNLLSGVLAQGLIPSLGSGWGGTILSSFLSGTISSGIIPNLDASIIVSGLLALARIPDLPTSIITSGTFADSILPGLGSLRDAISQAIYGGSTTGYTAAQVKTALLNIPGANIVSAILASVVPNLDATKIVSGILAATRAPWAAQTDTLMTAWGATSSGYTSTDLYNQAQAIPYQFVGGLLGLLDIGSAVQSMLDYGLQGLTGTSTINNSLSLWKTAFSNLVGIANSAVTAAQSANNTLAQKSVTQSVGTLDRTLNGPFNLRAMFSNTSALTFVNVTQAATAACNLSTPEGGIKQSVKFWGQGTTGITEMYVTIYDVDEVTNARTRIWESSNIIGYVSNTLEFNQPPNEVPIPAAYYIDSQRNKYYNAEIRVMGTGTYQIVGLTGDWYTDNVNPPTYGETRDGVPPTYLSAGPGNAGTGTTLVMNETHNIPADANCIMVGVHMGQANSSTLSATAKVGSTNMTMVGTAYQYGTLGGSFFLKLAIFQLTGASIPTGSQVISTTITGASGQQKYGAINSVAYKNASSVGTTLQTANGATTSLSQTVTADGSSTVFQMFGTWQGGSPITNYNRNQRWNYTGVSGIAPDTIIGDATGAASVTFTANSPAAVIWGGIAVSIIGQPGAAPSSIASPVPSPNVPYLGLSGAEAIPHLQPVPWSKTTAGSATYNIPSQFQVAGMKLDIVVLGAGAGGSTPVQSLGGKGGHFATAVTLTYGTDIPLGTTSFSVVVGAGGAVVISGARNPGTASTVTIPTYGVITGSPGGSTGTGINAGGNTTPQSITLNDIDYEGGLGGSTSRQPGQRPGGGGGGNSGLGDTSGAGADGAVWIRAWQP